MFRRRINYYPYLIILVLLIAVCVILLIDYNLKASVIEIAESKAQVTTTESINKVINQEVVAKTEYKDIVDIHKDNNGRIVLIQPNTVILNKMMANTVIEVSKSLDQLSEKSIDIPIGQITGSRVLAGYGPKVKVKIVAVGQVQVDVLNKFEAAGINQTRHLVYLFIKNKLKVAVPFVDKEFEVCTTIPLAETIIIGDVPETYVTLNDDTIPLLYPFIRGNN